MQFYAAITFACLRFDMSRGFPGMEGCNLRHDMTPFCNHPVCVSVFHVRVCVCVPCACVFKVGRNNSKINWRVEREMAGFHRFVFILFLLLLLVNINTQHENISTRGQTFTVKPSFFHLKSDGEKVESKTLSNGHFIMKTHHLACKMWLHVVRVLSSTIHKYKLQIN